MCGGEKRVKRAGSAKRCARRGGREAPSGGPGGPPPPKIAQACLLLYLRAGPPRPGRAPAGPGRAPAGRAGPGWQKKIKVEKLWKKIKV